MSNVFVIDSDYKPLNPVHPARARRLLKQKKAAIYRQYPFTIVLKQSIDQPEVPHLRLKIAPSRKVTGLAIVNDANGKVVFAAELFHRGQNLLVRLERRRAIRRSRRQRKTRYRKSRFQNRRRKKGWLHPSLESRLANILTWVHRLCRYAPIAHISLELAKFDLHLLEDPEIRGVQYQQGTVEGYEIRAFLLEKWKRKCAYCERHDVPLQVEHIHARSNGGTNRIGNLSLACEPCNTAKGTQDIAVFLAQKPDNLKRFLAQAKKTLKRTSAVNATRRALFERLKVVGIPVECGTGGLTKYNRITKGLIKTHWLDAVCVGKSTPEHIEAASVVPLLIIANGHGSRQMCRMNRYGFPRTGPKKAKRVHGFQTGDIVKAVVTSGKKVGTYIGRVAVCSNGSFSITTTHTTIRGIRYHFCQLLHRSDGYSYRRGEPFVLHKELLKESPAS